MPAREFNLKAYAAITWHNDRASLGLEPRLADHHRSHAGSAYCDATNSATEAGLRRCQELIIVRCLQILIVRTTECMFRNDDRRIHRTDTDSGCCESPATLDRRCVRAVSDCAANSANETRIIVHEPINWCITFANPSASLSVRCVVSK